MIKEFSFRKRNKLNNAHMYPFTFRTDVATTHEWVRCTWTSKGPRLGLQWKVSNRLIYLHCDSCSPLCLWVKRFLKKVFTLTQMSPSRKETKNTTHLSYLPWIDFLKEMTRISYNFWMKSSITVFTGLQLTVKQSILMVLQDKRRKNCKYSAV